MMHMVTDCSLHCLLLYRMHIFMFHILWEASIWWHFTWINVFDSQFDTIYLYLFLCNASLFLICANFLFAFLSLLLIKLIFIHSKSYWLYLNLKYTVFYILYGKWYLYFQLFPLTFKFLPSAVFCLRDLCLMHHIVKGCSVEVMLTFIKEMNEISHLFSPP